MWWSEPFWTKSYTRRLTFWTTHCFLRRGNMIQPFWALPALGIAKLSARDIMGYLVVILLFTGAVACLGFLGWALFF